MARSTHVYVLTNQGGAEPAFGFTVKHELITHMQRYKDGLPGRNVFRMPDGNRAGVVMSWPAMDYLTTYG